MDSDVENDIIGVGQANVICPTPQFSSVEDFVESPSLEARILEDTDLEGSRVKGLREAVRGTASVLSLHSEQVDPIADIPGHAAHKPFVELPERVQRLILEKNHIQLANKRPHIPNVVGSVDQRISWANVVLGNGIG